MFYQQLMPVITFAALQLLKRSYGVYSRNLKQLSISNGPNHIIMLSYNKIQNNKTKKLNIFLTQHSKFNTSRAAR
jgi:hypothetical protein